MKESAFKFGIDFTFGAVIAISVMVLSAAAIDWVTGKVAAKDHHAHYMITISKDANTYFTEGFDRKVSGQIVFFDCETGNEVTLQPNRDITIHRIVDTDKIPVCKGGW
jgi:hypothetical protein